MNTYIIYYKTTNGFTSEMEVAAANRFMAWEIFQEYCEENEITVTEAECLRKMEEQQ